MLLRAILLLIAGYFLVKFASKALIEEKIERPSRFRLKILVLVLTLTLFLYHGVIYAIAGRFNPAPATVSLVVFTSLVVLLETDAPLQVWPQAYLLTILALPFLLKFVVVKENFVYRFVQVALREEGFKFLIILLLFLSGSVKKRRDSLVAGASVGAVFGSLENYLYGTKFGFSTFAMRNLLPVHLSLSALMAFFFYKTITGRAKPLWFAATLAVAPFLHWAYDFSLQNNSNIIPYILLNLLLYVLIFVLSKNEG